MSSPSFRLGPDPNRTYLERWNEMHPDRYGRPDSPFDGLPTGLVPLDPATRRRSPPVPSQIGIASTDAHDLMWRLQSRTRSESGSDANERRP